MRQGLQYLLVFTVLAAGSPTVTAQSDWEVVMTRVHESAMAEASHQNLDDLLDLLEPDGSFSDLKYGEDGSNSFRSHGRRLSALGYHLHSGQDVTHHLLSSFTYITYDAPPNTDSNWWGHVIGTPTYMWQAAVLARDTIDGGLMTDFLDRYWVNTAVGAVWDLSNESGSMAGGNLAPRAMLAEVEGLLRGTHAAVHAEVTQVLWRELVDREGHDMNGLRHDGCLHQHSVQGDHNTEHGYLDHTLGLIYNGNYGKEQLRFSTKLFKWYTGTDVDFEELIVEGLFSAYLECNQWLYRGHIMEPTVTGRFVTSGSTVTKYATQGGVRDPGNDLLLLGRHQAEVEAALHRYNNVLPDPEFALVGNKYFFNSDLTVHQRREFMASVRVLSNRTSRQETWTSGQNIDGFFQGDGFMTVLVGAEEYGTPGAEVFQVYDWARVPGVTNLYTTDIPQYHLGAYWAERFFNNAKFVGGVTDGEVGVTFMKYNRPHVPLTALKSWFFFGDVIVVMGSGISLDPQDATGESVATTLVQSAYAGEHLIGRMADEEIIYGAGSYREDSPAWLHHRQVGYVFLGGDEKLTITTESRPHEPNNIDVFTAWLDHGPSPQDAELSYAVLPAADPDRTSEFADNPEVEVISLSSTLHAVCHAPSKTVGAALVSEGAVAVASCGGAGPLEVWVDTPCLAVVTVIGSQVRLSLADPQQTYDQVQVKVTLEGRQVEQTVELPAAPHQGSSVTLLVSV